jgi:hypothetical protein
VRNHRCSHCNAVATFVLENGAQVSELCEPCFKDRVCHFIKTRRVTKFITTEKKNVYFVEVA